jgi:glycosyltransferase involved in cell wall biosynthesis
MNKVLVSIVCVTYNHEKYIAQAIESFLAQKTSFLFEIVIHDDCSTDGTSAIINNYKKLYPDIIKIIHQSVNQFSQGRRVYPLAFDYCQGEFFALCDGDDYWLSDNKLQLQVDALKINKSVDLCFHSAFNLIPNGKLKKFRKNFNNLYFLDINSLISKIKKNLYQKNNEEYEIIPVEKVIEMGGEFAHTGSLLIRSSALNDLPEFIRIAPVSDFYLQIFCSVRGGAIYLNKFMSVYRKYSTVFSWSSSMKSLTKRKKWLDETIGTNNLLNEYFEYRFNNSFNYINSSCFCNMSLFYLIHGRFKDYSNLIQIAKKSENPTGKVYCHLIYYTRPINWFLCFFLNFFKYIYRSK